MLGSGFNVFLDLSDALLLYITLCGMFLQVVHFSFNLSDMLDERITCVGNVVIALVKRFSIDVIPIFGGDSRLFPILLGLERFCLKV